MKLQNQQMSTTCDDCRQFRTYLPLAISHMSSQIICRLREDQIVGRLWCLGDVQLESRIKIESGSISTY